MVVDLTGNMSKISLMASKAVYIKDQQGGKNGDYDELLASVVGLKIAYESFYKMFQFITDYCPPAMGCDTTKCSSDVSHMFIFCIQTTYKVLAFDYFNKKNPIMFIG